MSLQQPPPSPPGLFPPGPNAGLTPEQPDGIKPWTIRGVPPEERNAAIAAASKSDMNLGDWIARAIRAGIQQERDANRSPVVVGQAAPASDISTGLSDVERVASSIRDLAAAGIPISKAHASKITRALVDRLPRLTPRATNGRKFSAAAISEGPQPPDLNSAP